MTAGQHLDRGGQGERGAALVEFALVMPILAMFLFGIVQFGIAYDRQQSVNSAAREGARLGALDSTNLVDIAQRAVGSYDSSAAPDDGLVVVVKNAGGAEVGRYTAAGGVYSLNPSQRTDPERMPCGADPQSAYVRLEVSAPYDITIPFFGVQSVTLTSEAEFRCE